MPITIGIRFNQFFEWYLKDTYPPHLEIYSKPYELPLSTHDIDWSSMVFFALLHHHHSFELCCDLDLLLVKKFNLRFSFLCQVNSRCDAAKGVFLFCFHCYCDDRNKHGATIVYYLNLNERYLLYLKIKWTKFDNSFGNFGIYFAWICLFGFSFAWRNAEWENILSNFGLINKLSHWNRTMLIINQLELFWYSPTTLNALKQFNP